jgi:hypothetical protein
VASLIARGRPGDAGSVILHGGMASLLQHVVGCAVLRGPYVALVSNSHDADSDDGGA